MATDDIRNELDHIHNQLGIIYAAINTYPSQGYKRQKILDAVISASNALSNIERANVAS